MRPVACSVVRYAAVIDQNGPARDHLTREQAISRRVMRPSHDLGSPLLGERRRECRALAATHFLAEIGPPAEKTQAAVTTGSAEHPAFPARWAYGLYVISSGTG
jgi:hypothetical protein